METERTLTLHETAANATAIYQRMPDPLAAIEKMGQMFASSGMFGCSKLEQGQVLALACFIEGKSPFDLMRDYFIINGSLSMKATAVLAKFMQQGGKVTWQSDLNSDSAARANFSINGSELENAVYTIEDAKREGLTTGPNKHNWSARPADMLRARLITKAVRMIAPGIILGLPVEDEVQKPTSRQLLPNGDKTDAPAAEAPQSLQERLIADGFEISNVVDFLVGKGMLKPDQGIADLPSAAYRKIMKNYEEFIQKFKEATREAANVGSGES